MNPTEIQTPDIEIPVDAGTREQYARIRAGAMSELEFFRLIHADGVVNDFLNVKGFEIMLNEYLKLGIKGTLVAVDLDYFKNFNDNQGHPAGDDLLRLAGKILYEQTRTTEADEIIREKRKTKHAALDLLARAGDEFLVFLVEAKGDDAVEAAERIRIAIEVKTKTEFPNYNRRQTMSLGLSEILNRDGVENIRQRADQALYQAKKGKESLNPADSIVLV